MNPSAGAPSEGGGLLGAVDRVVAKIEDFFNDVGGVFIFLLMFLTMGEVLGRRLFNSPIPGTIDYIELFMVTFAFLGAAHCQRHGAHVRMDLVVGRLRGRALWAVEAIAILISAAYIAVIIQASYADMMRAVDYGDSTVDLQLQVWPSKLIVPISMTLLEIRFLLQLWGYLRLFMRPDATPVAVPAIKDTSSEAQEQIEEVMHHLHDDRPDQK